MSLYCHRCGKLLPWIMRGLADCIIRIMDYGLAKGYRVAEAIEAKISFNRTRPHMHGGKRF